MLLSDPRVLKTLRENYVLCWESVRPAPQVTIDFGNGRKLQRTLKGNTVLYLCMPDGRVVDAFPGVYTPKDFLPALAQARALYDQLGDDPEPTVKNWHRQRCPTSMPARAETTVSKMAVESPLLLTLDLLGEADQKVDGLRSSPAFARWVQVLEDLSRQPRAVARVRDPQALVAYDSRQNLTYVRPAVHLLMAAQDRLPQPDECRDVIYKQILKVPIDDPYLGLGDPGVPGTP